MFSSPGFRHSVHQNSPWQAGFLSVTSDNWVERREWVPRSDKAFGPRPTSPADSGGVPPVIDFVEVSTCVLPAPSFTLGVLHVWESVFNLLESTDLHSICGIYQGFTKIPSKFPQTFWANFQIQIPCPALPFGTCLVKQQLYIIHIMKDHIFLYLVTLYNSNRPKIMEVINWSRFVHFYYFNIDISENSKSSLIMTMHVLKLILEGRFLIRVLASFCFMITNIGKNFEYGPSFYFETCFPREDCFKHIHKVWNVYYK